MAKTKIKIAPSNGLSLPELGHLAHGEHELDLTADQVALFESEGAEGVSIVKAKPQGAPKQGAGKTKPEDLAELNTAILETIAGLDQNQDNGELWTKTEGVPQTAALTQALGYAVTAAERDAALASK